MPKEFNSENLELKYISDVETEEYKSFQCDRDELNQFLQEDALEYHQQNLTKTMLAFYEGGLVGFFSLSSDGIKLTDSEVFDLGVNGDLTITYFPAVKITKLAVSLGQEGKGIGSCLLSIIEGLVYDLPMAIRFLTLDAVDESHIVGFYERNGFVKSLSPIPLARGERRRTVLMHKDIYAD